MTRTPAALFVRVPALTPRLRQRFEPDAAEAEMLSGRHARFHTAA